MAKVGVLLALGAVLSISTAADAAGNYMYGFVVEKFSCQPQYGAAHPVAVATNVLQYCPFGPNAFDGPGLPATQVTETCVKWHNRIARSVN
jgi:hypothetical protein